MKTLLLGGVKSGKSKLAESMAIESGEAVTLIVTACAKDAEMQARIEHHKRSRPAYWQVIEEPLSLADALLQPLQSDNYIIIDCLTMWVTNLLLHKDNNIFVKETSAFIDIVSRTSRSVTMISNETSMGIIPMGELTRRFCDETGLLHQTLASECDNVILTIAGLPMALKGSVHV